LAKIQSDRSLKVFKILDESIGREGNPAAVHATGRLTLDFMPNSRLKSRQEKKARRRPVESCECRERPASFRWAPDVEW
jgi:hypothetical protein